jgi:hypothetical protein
VRRTFTSYVNGKADAGALQIEFDFNVIQYATAGGDSGSYLKIWGIALSEISKASDYNGMAIRVEGGMQKGLPLATPAQSGLLINGYVDQCFGNWIGTEMTLDFIIRAGTGIVTAPKNIVLNWPKGQPMSTAVTNALAAAFPTKWKSNVAISPNLVLGQNEFGYFETVTQFAQYLNKTSKAIINKATYRGVQIHAVDNVFYVKDDTQGAADSTAGDVTIVTGTPPKAFNAYDLIGQPTWDGPAQYQVTCVLRGDLDIGTTIKLPPTLVTTAAGAQSQFRDKLTFSNLFDVVGIRHLGSFRQPSATSWITVLSCLTHVAAA